MIVWSGLGFLIVIVGVLALAGTQVIVSNISGSPTFYQDNPWVILIGMLSAALLTFLLNKTILASKTKAVLDKETGEEILLQKNHSLFFIPAKWWPAIFVLIGIIASVAGYTKG